MKRIFLFALCLVVVMCLAGCGGSGEAVNDAPAEPLDLTGTWVQTNSNSEDMWHEAVITGDTIEVNWVSDGGNTKSLYWAGSYTAPTEATEEYAWVSENDTEKTSSALLASGDETKDFKYSDGVLSYEASAMGTTMTVKLERQ